MCSCVCVQVLYKVYISFVEVGAENVQTADCFKGVGESRWKRCTLLTPAPIYCPSTPEFLLLSSSSSPHPDSGSSPSSLLPHRQHRRDSGRFGLCRHSRLHHSLHQEGSHHRASLRLPAGLPGLPDCRALLVVGHPVVSPAQTKSTSDTSVTTQNLADVVQDLV